MKGLKLLSLSCSRSTSLASPPVIRAHITFFIPPCYSDMSIQLTLSFPGPRSVSPSWSCVTPLCLNPAVVLIVFLPPGEPNNEIPFGNQDLSAWRDVHVFIYLNVYSFTWLGSLSAVFWPVFFFAFLHSATSLCPWFDAFNVLYPFQCHSGFFCLSHMPLLSSDSSWIFNC